MKKIVIALAALALTAGMASAQDINAALETYNNAIALSDTDKAAALDGLKEALKAGEALGDEGFELVENCKSAIPALTLSLAKSQINEGEYDAALETLAAADSIAKEYGNEEIPEDVKELTVNVYSRRGSKLYSEKKWEEALVDLAKVIEAKPDDAKTLVKVAVANQGLGKMDEALEAYKLAAENGMAKQVNPRISNIYKKKAQEAQKAGKIADAVEALAASAEYLPDAGTFKTIGNLYSKLGKFTDANGAYEKYLEMSPTAPDADGVKYTIAVNAQKLGDKVTAKEYYGQLLGNAEYAAEAKKQLGAL